MVSTAKILHDDELRINGINALNDALGTTGAYRFLTLLHKEPTDYVKISEKIYESQTIDEIYQRASANWTKKSS